MSLTATATREREPHDRIGIENARPGLLPAYHRDHGRPYRFLGYWEIRTNIVERAQKQLRNHLWAARSEYRHEIKRMKLAFEMTDFAKIKNILGLDYFFVVEPPDSVAKRNPIALRAFTGNANGGTRIIDKSELIRLSHDLLERVAITIKPTPKARPSNLVTLTNAMAIEFAAPIFDSSGAVARIIYGGKIINRYTDLIQRIHTVLFIFSKER